MIIGGVSPGPAIGIIPNAHFKTTEAKLTFGDSLLFFTGGIFEVEVSDGNQFGIEGLRESGRSNLNQPTESLLDAVVSNVYKFGDSTVLTDDACLIAAELSSNWRSFLLDRELRWLSLPKDVVAFLEIHSLH